MLYFSSLSKSVEMLFPCCTIVCCLLLTCCDACMPTSGGTRVNYYSNGRMNGMLVTPQVKAARLSFSTVRMARDDDDKKVDVNLIPDVDSFTLTSARTNCIQFSILPVFKLALSLQMYSSTLLPRMMTRWSHLQQ